MNRWARMGALAAAPIALPVALRRLYAEPLSWQVASETLRSLLRDREARFLRLARSLIYSRPASTYARLLRRAGCELGDLEAMVPRLGLEETLRQLAAGGVYLSAEEWRGLEPVVRDGRVVVDVHQPVAERAGPGLIAHSSGTRAAPLPALYRPRWIAAEAVAASVFLQAHALESHVHSLYASTLPGTGEVKFLLQLGVLGIPFERWFVRELPRDGRLVRLYNSVVLRGLLDAVDRWGPGAPTPARDDLIEWLRRQHQDGRRCCVRTVVTIAVRIAKEARARGVELTGTTFIVSGEPLTETRLGEIEGVGARVALVFGFVPGGTVGWGCASPESIDDLHLADHIMTAVDRPGDDRERPTLLFTSLHEAAASFLLNVANGDRARLVDRDCGCALGEAGLHRHIVGLGSDRSLFVGGLSHSIESLIRLVDEVLPERLAGEATDFQIVETVRADGSTGVTLRVRPRLGERDSAELLEVFREELLAGSRPDRFAAREWIEKGALSVERRAPELSPRGKQRALLRQR